MSLTGAQRQPGWKTIAIYERMSLAVNRPLTVPSTAADLRRPEPLALVVLSRPGERGPAIKNLRRPITSTGSKS